jgi:hypothetical protein
VKSEAISLDAECGIFIADSWLHFYEKEKNRVLLEKPGAGSA